MPKGILVLGKRIRHYRMVAHMTRATLAARVGGSTENIKRIESADLVSVGVETAAKIASVLSVPVRELEVHASEVGINI